MPTFEIVSSFPKEKDLFPISRSTAPYDTFYDVLQAAFGERSNFFSHGIEARSRINRGVYPSVFLGVQFVYRYGYRSKKTKSRSVSVDKKNQSIDLNKVRAVFGKLTKITETENAANLEKANRERENELALLQLKKSFDLPNPGAIQLGGNVENGQFSLFFYRLDEPTMRGILEFSRIMMSQE